jgi:uncharacterized protein involved in exopolysaccharide biosynthesis
MITNRELTMDDYLAMLRRRLKVIIVPALFAPLVGYMVSYAFTPKWTSQALILVESQKVSEKMVEPVVTGDLTARVATLQQEMLSQNNMQPLVEKLFPGKNAEEQGAIVDEIRLKVKVEPVITDLSAIGTATPKATKAGTSPVPGFYLEYTGKTPREAQQICSELTSILVGANLKSVQDSAKGTSDVLSAGLEDAKHSLDDLDSKLAAFKKQYVGQLPGDEENNLKILMGLNSQLEANTQTLNRAQQDKAYTESLLAQQLAAWNSSQSSTNPQTLEKQLSELQSQLLTLQARYTADHPDVIKTKADIAEVKAKLAEVNKASANATDTGNEKASAMEPPEIRQFRLQIHQYSDLITAATRDQKRLAQEIASYQGRVALSPNVEEQYKLLTRDYENAQKNYQDLLGKKSAADLTGSMVNQSEGERMFALNTASLPDSPDFPNRLLFAAGGLAAGLALGCGLALWLELRDNSIRTEADAEAALELPLLVAVPWVGAVEGNEKNGKFGFWNRNKSPEEHKESIGA